MSLEEYTKWLYEQGLEHEVEDEPDYEQDEEDDVLEEVPHLSAEEKLAADLAAERNELLETSLRLDDHPEEAPPETEEAENKESFKREMLKNAIERIENAARTQTDFEDVVRKWDKLEQNEARRLRYHETSRGDVPLEFDKAMDGVIFPLSYMEPRWKQILSGNFLEVMHDCPFEMDKLTTGVIIIELLRGMRDDHKEIFYWHFIRQRFCAEVGRIRAQTDRNIRKTRSVILRKLRKQLQKALCNRQQTGYMLTLRQRRFLEQMEAGAIDEDDAD
jgi:hypothetical protein